MVTCALTIHGALVNSAASPVKSRNWTRAVVSPGMFALANATSAPPTSIDFFDAISEFQRSRAVAWKPLGTATSGVITVISRPAQSTAVIFHWYLFAPTVGTKQPAGGSVIPVRSGDTTGSIDTDLKGSRRSS